MRGDTNERGTCNACGLYGPTKLPRGRFQPGDGSEMRPFKHRIDGEVCPGSFEATWETMYVPFYAERPPKPVWAGA